MKILFSVIFIFFCKIFKNSNALNKDGYDVFQFFYSVGKILRIKWFNSNLLFKKRNYSQKVDRYVS